MPIRIPAFFLIALFCLPGTFTVSSLAYAKSEDSRKNDFSFMARIKGGVFKRGSKFNETKEYLKQCRKTDKKCQLWWFEDEFPQKLIDLDSFWIDIFEVTNARYLEFVRATGHRPALDDSCQTAKCREGNLWNHDSFPPEIRNQPVGMDYLSQYFKDAHIAPVMWFICTILRYVWTKKYISISPVWQSLHYQYQPSSPRQARSPGVLTGG